MTNARSICGDDCGKLATRQAESELPPTRRPQAVTFPRVADKHLGDLKDPKAREARAPCGPRGHADSLTHCVRDCGRVQFRVGDKLNQEWGNGIEQMCAWARKVGPRPRAHVLPEWGLAVLPASGLPLVLLHVVFWIAVLRRAPGWPPGAEGRRRRRRRPAAGSARNERTVVPLSKMGFKWASNLRIGRGVAPRHLLSDSRPPTDPSGLYIQSAQCDFWLGARTLSSKN